MMKITPQTFDSLCKKKKKEEDLKAFKLDRSIFSQMCYVREVTERQTELSPSLHGYLSAFS